VNIIKSNTINIEVDFIDGMLVNGKQSNIIFSLPTFTVPIGYKIYEYKSNPIYYPVNKNTIGKYRVRIVDENNKLISFNGEEICMSLHIQQI
jgi:hypothetical protein